MLSLRTISDLPYLQTAIIVSAESAVRQIVNSNAVVTVVNSTGLFSARLPLLLLGWSVVSQGSSFINSMCLDTKKPWYFSKSNIKCIAHSHIGCYLDKNTFNISQSEASIHA